MLRATRRVLSSTVLFPLRASFESHGPASGPAEPVGGLDVETGACGVRRLGAPPPAVARRSVRSSAGDRPSRGSLFACLRGCFAGHRPSSSRSAIALLDAYTTTTRRSEPAVRPEGCRPDSNVAVPGKSERKVWLGTTILFAYAACFFKRRALVIGPSAVSYPVKSRGQWRRVAALGATELRSGRRRSSHCVLSRYRSRLVVGLL